jgi:hypothetical protein
MMAIIGGAHAHHTRDGAGVLGSVKGALPSVAATPPLTPPARARQRVARVMGIRMLRRGFRAPDGHRVVGVIPCAKAANNLVDNTLRTSPAARPVSCWPTCVMASARLVRCGNPPCTRLFVLCSRCDRGHWHCGPRCSSIVRKQRQKQAAYHDRRSPSGRRMADRRQQRRRDRKKPIVTHQATDKLGPVVIPRLPAGPEFVPEPGLVPEPVGKENNP